MNWQIEQNTAILFGMTMALLGLCLLLAYVVDDLIRTKAQVAEDVDEASDVMIDAVLHQVGHVLLAERLRELARNYESPENVSLRKRLGRTEWKEGGTPLPALWLMAVADEISPAPEEYADVD